MPRALRYARVTLLAPIAHGGRSEVVGWVSEEGTAGVRVHEQKDLRGRQQWIPGHLVESVEEVAEPGVERADGEQ